MKTIRKKIVATPTGTYIKDWSYSQGNLHVEETLDIFQALDIAEDHFKTFFESLGLHYTVEYTATFVIK